MRKTILVVDDEEDISALLDARLGRAGYEVRVAHDGEDALRKVRVVKPDLIILDVVMPKLDGGEVFHRLRENRKTRDIPVIFLTGLKKKEDDLQLGFNVGRHSIFAKPYDAQELLGTIQELLSPSD